MNEILRKVFFGCSRFCVIRLGDENDMTYEINSNPKMFLFFVASFKKEYRNGSLGPSLKILLKSRISSKSISFIHSWLICFFFVLM